MELIMKKFVIALMAFALVITLAGCGGGGGGGGAAYVLNRGDNGAALKDYGEGKDLTPVKTAYDELNTAFSANNKDNDKEGTNRANAFKAKISENYHGDRDNVSNKAKLVSRLKSLISSKEFEGIEIIPFATKNGSTTTSVKETTKLYVASFKYKNVTYSNSANNEYLFDSVEWVKENDGQWRIVSGFDDLGKSASELTGN